jgi:electron transport complex protein RnfB
MKSDTYRKLAAALDRIPNGFASTESGVELELLATMFDEPEAALGAVMSLEAEAPSAIAERAGVAAEAAAEILERMVGKGLIRALRSEDAVLYGLIPFVVGVYENQLGRMDETMAALFEKYYLEVRGGAMTSGSPPVHRVIPVDEAIPQDLEIFPYEQAVGFIERARAWGVRDCICRVQQKLIGKGCVHTVENCLVFAPSPGVFDDSSETRAVTKEEALEVLSKAAEEGLVHSAMNQRDQIHYICNCCTCCCGIIRGVAEFGIPTAVATSDFRVTVDAGECSGCGACVERCNFGALSVAEGMCIPDYAKCVGCGICVQSCPVTALSMERRPEGEVETPPGTFREWLGTRAERRGPDGDSAS